MDIAITTERADEKGWIAFAPEVRATAQGSTEEEAKANLKALLKRYPDCSTSHDRPRTAASSRSAKGVEELPSLSPQLTR